MLRSIFRKKSPNSQLIDPFAEWELERSSLPELRQFIADVWAKDEDAAKQISGFVADPIEIGQFVETIFRHAKIGYVQLRMFVDGERKRPWGWPWQAVPVPDKLLLIATATVVASHAALSSDRVNFCPPVATVIGPKKATKDDICEGVAIMVECDDRPEVSRQTLEGIFGVPTLVVKSGGVWTDPNAGLVEDKAHLYWRLSTPARGRIEHDKLNEARVLASRIVSSDPTATPSCHPLRWPGSWHKKGEPRVARIAEYNPDREVDLDQTLTTLRDAAKGLGIKLRDDERKPAAAQLTDLSRDNDVWDAERDSGHILAAWRSETSRRHYHLSRYAVKIAMSALNKGYEINETDLYYLVRQMHDENPPTSRYKDKELRRLANEALRNAIANVGDQPAYKVKAERDAYWAQEWGRISRELRGEE